MSDPKVRAYWLRIAAALAVLVVLIAIVNVAAHGAFLQPGNIVRVLRQITYNCILGVGQTFVIITGGIDLSIGSLVSLTGVVMALVANSLHLLRAPVAHRDADRRARRRAPRQVGSTRFPS